jgi:hypothetical protein
LALAATSITSSSKSTARRTSGAPGLKGERQRRVSTREDFNDSNAGYNDTKGICNRFFVICERLQAVLVKIPRAMYACDSAFDCAAPPSIHGEYCSLCANFSAVPVLSHTLKPDSSGMGATETLVCS